MKRHRVTSRRLQMAAVATSCLAAPLVLAAGNVVFPGSPGPHLEADSASVHEVLIGDPSGSGDITSLDGLITLSAVVKGVSRRGDLIRPLSDTDCDGTVGSLDALILLSHLVDKDVSGTCVGAPTTIRLALSASADTVTALGDTASLTALVTDSAGNPLDSAQAIWSRVEGDGLAVDSAGLVIADGNGVNRVRAFIGGAEDTLTIVVRQVAASLQLTPDATEIPIGDTIRLDVGAWDRRGEPIAEPVVAWTTSEPAVAIVDSTGLVRTGGEGSVEITATVDTLTGAATVSTLANDSTVVTLSLDDGLRTTMVVDSAGGTLALTDASGVAYALTIPPGALLDSVEIAATPIAALTGTPAPATLSAGVAFEPAGLEFLRAATLRMTPPGGATAGLVGFGGRADGTGFHLRPVSVEGDAWRTDLSHFSTGGVVSVEQCWIVGTGLVFEFVAKQILACVSAAESGSFDEWPPESQAMVIEAFRTWFWDWVAYLLSEAIECAHEGGGALCVLVHERGTAAFESWKAVYFGLESSLAAALAFELEHGEALVEAFLSAQIAYLDGVCLGAAADPAEQRRILVELLFPMIQRSQLMGRIPDLDPGGLCGGAPHRLVGSVAVQPDTVRVADGDSVMVGVTARNLMSVGIPADTVAWSIANPAVAIVPADSTATTWVRGVAEGSTTLSASVQGVADTVPVDVELREVTIVLEPSELLLAIGASVQITATPQINGVAQEGVQIEWYADAVDVSFWPDTLATVDANGLVTAVALGPGYDDGTSTGWMNIVATANIDGHFVLETVKVKPFVNLPDTALDNIFRSWLVSKGRTVDQLTPLTWDLFPVGGSIEGPRAENRPVRSLSGVEYLPIGQLFLPGAQIQDLWPLAGLRTLRFLDVSGSPVSDLTPLAGTEYLWELDIADTQVSDLSTRSWTTLWTIDLSRSLVSDITPLSGAADLLGLIAYESPISDISALAGKPSLRSVWIDRTQVSDISPLADATSLTSLRASETPISDISALADLTGIEALSLGFTEVSDLSPLAGMSSLETVNFSHTPVSDVSPLATVTGLATLSLYNTQVADVSPLAGLPNLRYLHVGASQVADLTPLASSTSLVHVSSWHGTVTDLSGLVGGDFPGPGDTLAIRWNRLAERFDLDPAPEEGPTNVETCGEDTIDRPALEALLAQGAVVLLNPQYYGVCRDVDGDGLPDVLEYRYSARNIYTDLFPPYSAPAAGSGRSAPGGTERPPRR